MSMSRAIAILALAVSVTFSGVVLPLEPPLEPSLVPPPQPASNMAVSAIVANRKTKRLDILLLLWERWNF